MATPDPPLTGRKVLVMGASSATGEAIAARFIAEGCRVALTTATADPDEAFSLTRIARRLGKDGGPPRAEAVDMSVGTAVQMAQRKLVKDLGGLDVLVAMPGLRLPGPAERMSEADWAKVIGTNLGGAFFACKAAAREMAQGGVILILTGMTAALDARGEAAYAAAVAGSKALAEALAAEWRQRNIAVEALDLPTAENDAASFAAEVVRLATDLTASRDSETD